MDTDMQANTKDNTPPTPTSTTTHSFIIPDNDNDRPSSDERQPSMLLLLLGLSRGQRHRNVVLKLIYIITTMLCILMVFWILIFPSSWLFGRWKQHDDIVVFALEQQKPLPLVPTHIFTKFTGHTLIHMTHILPGAIWSSIIPFQLHTEFRTKYYNVHHFMGYIFLLCSLLISIGIGLILQRKLVFEHFFFPDSSSSSSRPSSIITISKTSYYYYTTEVLYGIVGIWFTITAGYAIQYARNHQYISHQKWMIRHIASGLWIAIQRTLLCTIFQWNYYPRPYTPNIQRIAFATAGKIAIIISLSLGEFTIYLLLLNQQQRKLQKHQKEN